jgi:hypothetical protein
MMRPGLSVYQQYNLHDFANNLIVRCAPAPSSARVHLVVHSRSSGDDRASFLLTAFYFYVWPEIAAK